MLLTDIISILPDSTTEICLKFDFGNIVDLDIVYDLTNIMGFTINIDYPINCIIPVSSITNKMLKLDVLQIIPNCCGETCFVVGEW